MNLLGYVLIGIGVMLLRMGLLSIQWKQPRVVVLVPTASVG